LRFRRCENPDEKAFVFDFADEAKGAPAISPEFARGESLGRGLPIPGIRSRSAMRSRRNFQDTPGAVGDFEAAEGFAGRLLRRKLNLPGALTLQDVFERKWWGLAAVNGFGETPRRDKVLPVRRDAEVASRHVPGLGAPSGWRGFPGAFVFDGFQEGGMAS